MTHEIDIMFDHDNYNSFFQDLKSTLFHENITIIEKQISDTNNIHSNSIKDY